MDELTIGDKIYISSKKAAQITGYAKDYVGQLCREGHVEARMVGRNWYVLESSIQEHRFGKPAPSTTSAEPAEKAVEGTVMSDAIEQAEAPMAEATPVEIAPLNWKAPTYAVETPEELPILTPRKSVNVLDSEVQTTPELTDMQSAWREWFDSRKGETLLETPEIIDAREEAAEQDYTSAADIEAQAPVPAYVSEEVAVPVSIRREESAPDEGELEEGAEAVAIHRTPLVSHRQEETLQRPVHRREEKNMRKARTYEKRAPRVSSGSGNVVMRTVLLLVIFASLAAAAVGTGYAEKYVPNFGSSNVLVKYLGGTRTVNK